MSAIWAMAFAPFVWLAEHLLNWTITNNVYATLVLFAIAADHVLGTAYHLFWKRDFSIKKNLTGLIVKLLIVVTVGYLFEGLNEMMAGVPILKDYTITTLRLLVFLYPAGSAFNNSYEMTNKQFPPMGFMEWLKKFAKNDKN
jgi:uncharacterized radical SAM superfamily protein